MFRPQQNEYHGIAGVFTCDTLAGIQNHLNNHFVSNLQIVNIVDLTDWKLSTERESNVCY